MIKSISAMALALSVNSSDISASAYQNILAENLTKYSPSMNKEKDFHLTAQEKENLLNLNTTNMESLNTFNEMHKKAFKNNFHQWVVRDSEVVHDIVKNILSMSNEFIAGFEKEAKYYKKYPSIANKLTETAKVWKDIREFTIAFKVEADEAHEANIFMNTFIKSNEEVLEALA